MHNTLILSAAQLVLCIRAHCWWPTPLLRQVQTQLTAFRSLPALSSTACFCSVHPADCSTTSPLDALDLLLPKPKVRQTYGMPARDGPAGRWLSSKGLQGRRSILAFVPHSSLLPLATPVLAQHAEGGRFRTRYGRRGAVPRRDCAQASFLLHLLARPRLLADALHLTASAGPSMEPSLYSYVPFSSPGGPRTAVGERACSASSSVRPPPAPAFPSRRASCMLTNSLILLQSC